ncbi:hypothetical protein FACS189487_03580 [Campylobacterota bacterium]|nr:hypothetical protein FACS189487_03580 [Campylobacterota bacterium]
MKWNSSSTASRFKHNIFYFLIRFGGRYAAYSLLLFVAAFYTLSPKLRVRAAPYLIRRFNEKTHILWKTYKLYFSFGMALVDRATLGITGKSQNMCSASDIDMFHSLYNQGKGLVVITAHVGSWQSAATSLDLLPGNKYIVYYRDKNDVDKQAHEHGGIKAPAHFIDPSNGTDAAVKIVAAFEERAIICVMGDRVFGSEKGAVSVPFLNDDIQAPATIYRIAAFYGAPVIIAFCPIKGAGKLAFEIADHFVVEDRGNNAESYKQEALRFARALEAFCVKYPYQYFNFFDIWRKTA